MQNSTLRSPDRLLLLILNFLRITTSISPHFQTLGTNPSSKRSVPFLKLNEKPVPATVPATDKMMSRHESPGES